MLGRRGAWSAHGLKYFKYDRQKVDDTLIDTMVHVCSAAPKHCISHQYIIPELYHERGRLVSLLDKGNQRGLFLKTQISSAGHHATTAFFF
jgi:hypothetical protein